MILVQKRDAQLLLGKTPSDGAADDASAHNDYVIRAHGP